MQTEGFKPFSGPHAFRVLEKAKERLYLEKVEMNDLLLAVSSLGLLLETEMALIYALQDQICTRCGKCCIDNTSLNAQKEELKSIADYKNTSYKKLKKSIRASPRKNGTLRFTRRPCPFYEDECTVYNIRPGVCRAYPTNKLLAAISGRINQYPENCEIADDLLAELAIKRALEEKMYRENPELMLEIAENKRDELTRLTNMTQTQRFQFLINKYQKNLQEP
jgi:Fe-S-cluster containining protein